MRWQKGEHRKNNRVPDLGFYPIDLGLGSVPSNVFTVVLGTLNTFDGTDPKVFKGGGGGGGERGLIVVTFACACRVVWGPD